PLGRCRDKYTFIRGPLSTTARRMEQRARFGGADRRRYIRGLHHASGLALAAAALAAVACPLRYLLGWVFLVSATLSAMSGGITRLPDNSLRISKRSGARHCFDAATGAFCGPP